MQGLKKNISQFILLVFVNFLVGSIVGIERSSLYEYATESFHVKGGFFYASFILTFGISKAVANLLVAKLILFRNKKWLLVFGWILVIPGILMIMYAQSWWYIILANVLIGLNQGFCWSSNVMLKIDLVGSRNRGLAMGFNEFSGYLAVGVFSLISGYMVSNSGFDNLFTLLLLVALLGLIVSFLFVNDTTYLLRHEESSYSGEKIKSLFKNVSYKHSQLFPLTLNGFMNNLVDGVYWVMFPIMLTEQDFSMDQIGFLAAIYPIVWALTQLVAGKLGDKICRKQLITIGMFLQSIGLVVTTVNNINGILLGSIFIGVGTGLVYPNFLSEVSSVLHPSQRAMGLSYFRFWRDMGYVGGALLIATLFTVVNTNTILVSVAILLLISTVYSEIKMCCLLKYFWKTKIC